MKSMKHHLSAQHIICQQLIWKEINCSANTILLLYAVSITTVKFASYTVYHLAFPTWEKIAYNTFGKHTCQVEKFTDNQENRWSSELACCNICYLHRVENLTQFYLQTSNKKGRKYPGWHWGRDKLCIKYCYTSSNLLKLLSELLLGAVCTFHLNTCKRKVSCRSRMQLISICPALPGYKIILFRLTETLKDTTLLHILKHLTIKFGLKLV